jgi:hypothetical protein
MSSRTVRACSATASGSISCWSKISAVSRITMAGDDGQGMRAHGGYGRDVARQAAGAGGVGWR